MAACLGIAIYVLIYWSDINEIWTDTFSRILIVMGLFMTYYVPILIPIDITLQYYEPDSQFMQYVWTTVQLIIMFFSLIIYPFMVFLLEEQMQQTRNKCKIFGCALLSSFVVIFVVLVIVIVLFYTMGSADIRVVQLGTPITTGTTQNLYDTDLQTLNSNGNNNTNVEFTAGVWTHIYIPLNFLTYMIAITTFLGAVLFTIFFSIGLALVPWDYIQLYRFRPRVMGKSSLMRFKQINGSKAEQMIHEIDLIYNKILKENYNNDKFSLRQDIEKNRIGRIFRGKRQLKNQYERLKRRGDELYTIYKDVMDMNDKTKANPLKYKFQLVKGILAAIFSCLIFIQLFAIMIYQFNPSVFTDANSSPFFLSSILLALDGATHMPLFSIIIFAIFSIYFSMCFLKGVTRFGFRFIMLFTIHEMRIHQTPLNSFMLNVMLMVLGILPQLQFMVFFFSNYSDGASVQIFFGKTVSNLRYLKEFFNYYVVVMLIIWIITTIVAFSCPGQFIREGVESLAGMGPEGKNKNGVSDYRQLDKRSRKAIKAARYE